MKDFENHIMYIIKTIMHMKDIMKRLNRDLKFDDYKHVTAFMLSTKAFYCKYTEAGREKLAGITERGSK
jgi:hypothetical protein